jgi:hypothetical protein
MREAGVIVFVSRANSRQQAPCLVRKPVFIISWAEEKWKGLHCKMHNVHNYTYGSCLLCGANGQNAQENHTNSTLLVRPAAFAPHHFGRIMYKPYAPMDKLIPGFHRSRRPKMSGTYLTPPGRILVA